MTLKPHRSPSLLPLVVYSHCSLPKLSFACTPHLVQSLQNTGHCKSTLQSSVSSFLKNAKGYFFSLSFATERRTLEHSCHIIGLSADTLYVHKSAHIPVSHFSFLTSFFPALSSYLSGLLYGIQFLPIAAYSNQLSTSVIRRYGSLSTAQ